MRLMACDLLRKFWANSATTFLPSSSCLTAFGGKEEEVEVEVDRAGKWRWTEPRIEGGLSH